MALIQCSECHGKVSDQALMCPHCGFGLQKGLGDNTQKDRSATNHEEIRDPSRLPLTQDEKRAYKRINIRMMAKINQETARISNISKGGMKLITPLPHNNPHIDITLDNGGKAFTIKGIIRWVDSKHSFSNLIDIGVEISAAPPEYYQFIDQLLANN
ncbi:MAG: PilZ domain-containing protein [Candidatus Aminicenantes bacterium]|nr:PilZ domain-containing protein [Candidatus Aminicenantes bacterium]